MKKNSVILRMACLCLALILLMAVPAAAAGDPEFRLNGPVGPVKAGEEFDVTIELVGNPGFYSIEFYLAFNRGWMECTRIEKGVLLDDVLAVTNPEGSKGAVLAGATVDGVTADGLIAVYHMRALVDMAHPEYTLEGVRLSDENGKLFNVQVTYPVYPTVPEDNNDPIGGDPQDEPDDPISTPPVVTVPDFSDVEGHWGIAYIQKAAEKGLFKGYEDGRFGPNDPVTRAQFVTVLYRMAGSPDAAAGVPFTDTDGLIEEFRKAIGWAYGNGYVNGRSETTFDPNGRITRQEAMKILFAYSGGVSGMEAMFTSIYDDAYADSGDIASWAKSAMYWGVYHELIKGMDSSTIAPTGTATRAQLAKILVVYSEKF